MKLEADRELSNEQKMEQSAITKERNDLKIDGTLENFISDVEKNKIEDISANPDHNSSLLQNINCRICLEEEASGADPIIQLGCQCKDDISFGHESCLKKWFVRRLLRSGFLDCELCRGPLGAHLKAIVKRNCPKVTTFQMQGVSLVLLLLQVPPDELDRLHLPHDIPDFYELPPHARRAIEDSLERQEQVHQRNENQRSANFMMAQNLVAQGEGPLRADQLQTRILRAAQLRDQFIIGPGPYRNTDDDDNIGNRDIDDDNIGNRDIDDDNSEDQDTNHDNNEDRDRDDDNSEDQNTNHNSSEDRDRDDDNSEDEDIDDDNGEDQDTYDYNSEDEDIDDDNGEDQDTYDYNSEDEDIDDDNGEDEDTYDYNNEDQDTDDGIMDLGAFREEPFRVLVERLSTAQQEEELLSELSLHVDLFAEVAQATREGVTFLPRSMFFRPDPVVNTTAPGSLAQQTAPAPRLCTYGRFQFFLLHDIV